MKVMDATTRVSFKNILLATDFSPVSESALLYAERIAHRYGSRIFAVHAVSSGEAPMVPPECWGSCQQILDEAAQREMQALSDRLRGIPHETAIGYGGVWEVLSHLIEKNEIDLLVMGTHGREGLGRFLLGSVAEEVFRQASCPVLTVGPKATGDLAQEVNFKEIVFATDLGPESEAAALYAISLAQEFQARLTLVHVVSGQVESPAKAQVIVQDRTEGLHTLIPEDVEMWCKPEYVVDFGDPARQILDVVRERKADLIVLGVRAAAGHLGTATHLAAATAHTVVSQAQCPVLTVRGPAGVDR